MEGPSLAAARSRSKCWEEPWAARCFAPWPSEGPAQLAGARGSIRTETKPNKWKLLPCVTVGIECFLAQLHANTPLAFPSQVSEIWDSFYHC